MAEGYNERELNRINELKAGAWFTALWSRVDGKHFPAFKDIMQSDKPRKKQTPEQMLEMCKVLNAAYGGEVVET